MAIVFPLDEQNLKQKEQAFDEDLLNVETLQPPADDNNEIGGLTSFSAGILSGAIKVVEGPVSLTAELMDLGAGALLNMPSTKGSGVSVAAEVEEFFDKINPFEEAAEARAAGKISQALTQIVTLGGLGTKLTTAGLNAAAKKLGRKAIQAKKTGNLVNPKAKNIKKGMDKAKQLNYLTGKERFGAFVLGGAAGETFVADVEKIGTIGDAFEAGPTVLDREVEGNVADDAARKLMNRLKFGSESLLLTPAVYGAGKTLKMLGKAGRDAAYNTSQILKTISKTVRTFTPEGTKPKEIFLAKAKEQNRKMADLNFGDEQVKRIDIELKKVFPSAKKILKTTESKKEYDDFLKTADEMLFKGDLEKGLDTRLATQLTKTITQKLGKGLEAKETSQKLLEGISNTREKFSELIDIVGESGDLRKLFGDRLKNYIGNTMEIFDNKSYSMFSKYRAPRSAVENVKNLFIRYAAKNNNPVTEEYAERMVNDVLDSVRKTNPTKGTLPTFGYENLTLGAKNPYNVKTISQIVETKLGSGKDTKIGTRVIGKGSKAFRELFGETEDIRHSIYEGVSRLSALARKNQMMEEVLDVDAALKSGEREALTPFEQSGFFHSSRKNAAQAFGPGAKIVELELYLKSFLREGVLNNRLAGLHTTEEIAEGFANVANFQKWMRGEGEGQGQITKVGTWLYRNLFLTPKAGAQYAKTVLSIPTHMRNFLSASAFSAANGIFFENPALWMRAMQKAGATVQMGQVRKPLSMERYRRYLELGVTNTNVRMGDMKNLMKDARFGENNVAVDSILKPMLNTLGGLGKGLKKGAKFMEDAYTMEDDFFKITNFEVEVERRLAKYRKAGINKSLEAIEEEAAEIVKNTVPNYAYVGEFVRASRSAPFGNFMSFSSEMFRTGTGIARQALDEIKDPITGSINMYKSTNPMKAIGFKRLTGMAAMTTMVPYAIIKGTQALFDITNEEADAGRDFVAPWAKNSQLVFFRDPKSKELYYMDYSKTNVYDTLSRPFQTILRQIQEGVDQDEPLMKGFIQGIAEAAGETASPFVDPSIFTEAVLDIFARNGVTSTGSELYTEQTPTGEKISRILKHLAKTQLPSTQAFTRSTAAIKGKPDTKTGEVYEIPYELAGIFGYRATKVNPEKSLGYYIYDYRSGQSNATREFTGGPEGLLRGGAKTPKEVIERYFIANKGLFDVRREMLQHIKNAETLGVNQDKIMQIFNKRGIPASDAVRLKEGLFKPFFPGEKVRQRFEDIAQETNSINPFAEAESIIQEMRNDFMNQNLYENFKPKLEDYLPGSTQQETTEGLVFPDQSSLDTPGINPANFDTAVMNQDASGLTSTETALLSPEEQAIRLRQRGQA